MLAKAPPELTIRPYTLNDVPAMVALFEEALPHLPNYHNITVDPERMRNVLRSNVKNATFMAVLLVTDKGEVVGGMAAQCTPLFFSLDTMASDTFLYIRESYRSLRDARRLLMAFVLWAKARRAKLIRASHTSGYDIAPLLTRLGFKEVGKIYHWIDKL